MFGPTDTYKFKTVLLTGGLSFGAIILILLLFQSLLPKIIAEANSQSILQSLDSIDGVILGFTSIVYGAILGRDIKKVALNAILLFSIPTVIFLLLSLLFSIASQANLSSAGSTKGEIMLPVTLLLLGVGYYFYGIAMFISMKSEYRDKISDR